MGRDILEESWFVQEWMKKGEEKGLKIGAMRITRKILLATVQAHFPEHMPLAKELVKRAKDPEMLEALTIKVIEAQDQQEVARLLEELDSQTKLSK